MSEYGGADPEKKKYEKSTVENRNKKELLPAKMPTTSYFAFITFSLHVQHPKTYPNNMKNAISTKEEEKLFLLCS